jgi:diaminopimelate decarboxylase
LKNLQLLEITNKYGSPLYVYDTDKIEEQYNRLTNAFSGVKNLKLNYAVKALSNINILQFFKNIGAGLDTVSIQEVQLGLTTGIDPKKIIFTPNGV